MKKRLLAFLLSAATVMPLCCIGAGAVSVNKAPTVIPAIREWDGGTGEFKLSDTVKINVKDAAVSDAKKNIITESFSSYLGVRALFTEEHKMRILPRKFLGKLASVVLYGVTNKLILASFLCTFSQCVFR